MNKYILPKLTVLLGFVLPLYVSCDLINPEEDAPVYLQIDTFYFNPAPTLLEMGPSNSTKIKDVWVWVDNEVQGIYELPVSIPVLASGKKPIVLIPGILLNGINATRSPYPFYEPVFDTIDFIPGTTVTLPVVPSTVNSLCDTVICYNYFDNTVCAWCEDFEGSGFSLTKTGSSDTSMYQTPFNGDNTVFEGTGSGVVYLDSNRKLFEISSTSDHSLPGGGEPVYLELDYKIDESMTVGLFVNLPGSVEKVPIINLNPRSDWNKIYLELGSQVSAYPTASGFKVYFSGVKDLSSGGVSSFYIDNVKLVHR